MSLLVMEHIEHPIGKGALTTDGVQYSAEVTTSDAEWTAVETVTVAPRSMVKFIELEFGLTAAIKSSSTAKYVKWKWQARNKDGTWQDLIAEQTRAADASAYADMSCSGRKSAVSGLLDQVPFDVRFVIKREDAAENATGKTKNSSYVKVIYPTT